jgi:signal transduction histidine kinase
VASQLAIEAGRTGNRIPPRCQVQRLEPTLENTLFRIAQEAMTNACRHSKSKKVRVKLTQKGDDVTLEVRDWGIGFDQDTVQENRFGLEGIPGTVPDSGREPEHQERAGARDHRPGEVSGD